MTPLIPLGAAALAWLMLRGKAAKGSDSDPSEPINAPESSNAEVVKKLVDESREIVRGKRDSYSDDPGRKVTPRAAAERVSRAEGGALQAALPQTTAQPVSDGAALQAAREAARAYGESRVKQGSPVNPSRPSRPSQPSQPSQPSPSQPSSPPAGYDRGKALKAADGLAKHIAGFVKRGKPFDYSRPVLKAWQTVAGIPADGAYGRGAAAALRHYVGAKAPAAIFKQGEDVYPWGAP